MSPKPARVAATPPVVHGVVSQSSLLMSSCSYPHSSVVSDEATTVAGTLVPSLPSWLPMKIPLVVSRGFVASCLSAPSTS